MQTASLQCLQAHCLCNLRAVPQQKPKKKQLVREASALMAANKYQMTDSLFQTTKKRQQCYRRRWHSFNLHKDLYHGRTTLFVADNKVMYNATFHNK